MSDKQKNNDVNSENTIKQNIDKKPENKDVKQQNNNIKEEGKQNKLQDEKIENKNENKPKNDKVKNKEKDNKQNKKSGRKNIIAIVVIIVIFILIDVILAVKTISTNEENAENNTTNKLQNVVEIITENRIEEAEEISYSYFSMNNYNFKINSKYKIDIQNDILTIQNNEEKAIVTINEGTMEQIQNNLNLLTVPIENQGANIIKNPELQNINGKDVYVLEYSIDEKNYIVAYTKLDEENIIDMIAENEESIELLIELSNNYTKV